MTNFDISFDDNHDMYLDGPDIAFADENNIVKQRLSIRLQFILEEWFLNTNVGIPYPQFVFEQGSDLNDIYSLFQQEIKNTDGVEDIVKLELIPITNNKGLRINFEVNKGTVSGTTEVSI